MGARCWRRCARLSLPRSPARAVAAVRSRPWRAGLPLGERTAAVDGDVHGHPRADDGDDQNDNEARGTFAVRGHDSSRGNHSGPTRSPDLLSRGARGRDAHPRQHDSGADHPRDVHQRDDHPGHPPAGDAPSIGRLARDEPARRCLEVPAAFALPNTTVRVSNYTAVDPQFSRALSRRYWDSAGPGASVPDSSASGFGQENAAGFPKNQYVRPYMRRDGTLVSGYWRNDPTDGLPTCHVISC